jgi:hypothetical protein
MTKGKIETAKVTHSIEVDEGLKDRTSTSDDAKKDIPAYHFTILDHSMTSWETLKETWRVYQNTKVEFRHLVALKPERIIFHEIVARIQAFVEQEASPSAGDEVFKNMIEKASKDIEKSKGYQEAIQNMVEDYKNLQEQIHLIMNDKPNGLTKEEIEIATKFINEAKKGIDEWSKDKQDACFQRILATLYMSRARQHAAGFAKEALEGMVTMHAWHWLPLIPVNESISVFTAGGVASGKTSSLIKVAEGISRHYQVEWKDMSHHNTDRLRTVLLTQPVDPKLYSSFTGDEARLVKERELEVLNELAQKEKLTVNEVHDSPSIKLDDFKDAVKNRKAVVVCVVSTDAEVALNRSDARGKVERRYVSAGSLLKSHQDAAKSVKTALAELGEAKNTTVFMYDNNGTTSELFCTINSSSKKIAIMDSSQLNLWLKKYNMNPKLGKLEGGFYELDLYPEKAVTPPVYFNPLPNKGYTFDASVALAQEKTKGIPETTITEEKKDEKTDESKLQKNF